MGRERVPDLGSLELLQLVDETGSLGQAGIRAGISQPAVSARVRGIERLVGFRVVDRGARGSTLTPAGRLLADWGRDVLQAADALAAGVASLRAGREARLRVAASLTVAEHLLPGWLVRFAAEHPGTSVRLDAMNSAEVEHVTLSGGVDVGFVEGPQVASGLDAVVVAEDRLVVVAPPRHPWAGRRRPLTAAELAGTRLVQREPASGTRTAFETAAAGYGPVAEPLLELSTTSAVRAAVAAGAGPAVLSHLAVDDDLASGRLVVVRVTGIDLSRRLRAVWPTGEPPRGPARDLVAIATSRARGPAGRP